MKIPKTPCVKTQERSLYDYSFTDESDLKLLEALSIRLQPVFGLTIPHKTFETFCRTIEKLCTDTCVLASHEFECNLSDLYKAKEKLIKIINFSSQQKFFRAKFKLGTMKVNLKVNRNDELFGSKTEIAGLFAAVKFNNEGLNPEIYTSKLEKRVMELEHKIEIAQIGDYLKAFPVDLVNCQDFSVASENCIFISGEYRNEVLNYKKFAACQNKILVDKEWDAFDAKVLKVKFSKKLKKLSVKKLKLVETENALRKKNIELEKEKNAIEKAKESMEAQKSRFTSQVQLKHAALSTFISDLNLQNLSFSFEEASSIYPKPQSDTTQLDNELLELSGELKTLEYQYKCSKSLNKHAIETQIEKVKNRVNSLKSLKAIQNLSKPSTTASSYLLEKSHSPNSTQSKNFFPQKPENSETELRRQLRIKELRLKEREEEILENEEKSIKYWQTTLDCQEIITNTLKAFDEFKSYKEKYERRLEFVEKKRLELQDTLTEINKRENDLYSLKTLIDEEKTEFELQKQTFSNKVKQLLTVLDKN